MTSREEWDERFFDEVVAKIDRDVAATLLDLVDEDAKHLHEMLEAYVREDEGEEPPA